MASASELKKSDYFKHNNDILRFIRKELVAYGTHSHSKLKIFAQPIDKNSEKIITMHHQDKVDILDIIRKAAQVISKTDNSVQIMDTVSYETMDSELPEDIEINEGDEVTFINLEGNVKIIEKR